MDVKTQLSGLEELLGIIYGHGMRLRVLLCELGFEEYQIDRLRMDILRPSSTSFWM
jgi:hypothetical protein